MAFSTVLSAAIEGLSVSSVYVEADISNGLPVFHMVGYLSSEVKEASERVRTAVKNSGFEMPAKRIVMNLAPANVRKRGASFDLPISLSLLMALGKIPPGSLEQVMVIGELSLDGKLRAVSGVLPIVLEAEKMGCKACILPKENELEGAIPGKIQIYGAESLKQVCDYLNGREAILPAKKRNLQSLKENVERNPLDFSEIQGQEAVKRAAEVAVAGGHNLLLVGPPGSGKSMIAQRIPTILPPPDWEESMEMTKIYSVSGRVDQEHPLITERPFCAVHQTVTKTALIGGGMIPSPGQISLAHGGVLFLDEVAEFPKSVLEMLRQPLEERKIRINRTYGNYEFPADFMLVCAMNPCPCGNYPDFSKCSCTPWQIKQYLSHISQPFLDRIDICIEAPKVEYEDLNGKKDQETSEQIRKRVLKARQIQKERFYNKEIQTNARLSVNDLKTYCELGREEEKMMKQAFQMMDLTARTYHKILKVARTIADLDGEENIRMEHLTEAIGYRTMDKKYWGR